jgi:predicted transcriptional regulator
MKILTVRLDDDLHKQFRLVAVERGETLQQITERLLREFVARETTRLQGRRKR